MPPAAAPTAVQRWTPWALGAAVAIGHVAIGRGGGGEDVPLWSLLVRLARRVPVGDVADPAVMLAALCAGAAAVLIARLAIALAGGGAACDGAAGASVPMSGRAAHP